MRASANAFGVTVTGYAGSTGALLAFNIEPEMRKGLLGFCLRRQTGSAAPETLCGMLPFPKFPHKAGDPIPTDQAPIQKFRWSDYTVHPDTEYKYTVQPVYGNPGTPAKPGKLDIRQGPTVTLRTEPTDVAVCLAKPGQHLVVFNRAAGASQAFARKFTPEADKLTREKKAGEALPKTLSPQAMAWLSRGVLEEIVKFIEQAKDKTFGLDVAIYQYELPQIRDAINAALDRGANVRLVYHAKKGDAQTAKNESSAAHLPKKDKVARWTSAICHHKFIVLSRMEGDGRQPLAVLCGSTNFTFNGVYCQANDVHLTSDPKIAKKYLEQFEFLFAGNNPKATSKHDTEQNVLDPAAPLQVGFSPRAAEGDLDVFISMIRSARRDVLFATAFDIAPRVYEALTGQPHDPILRYGVQDKATKMTGTHADRTAEFEAAAKLPEGLDGWLKEQRVPGQTGNILIHTKVIVVDFTSDSPVVISGSHNFSHNASANNDENYLIFRGNTAMADCYGIEVMRIYDHYRFRFVETTAAKKKQAKPPALTPNDTWTKDYFDPKKLKYADRLRFAGDPDHEAKTARAAAGGS